MKRLIVKGVTIAVMATALAFPLASPAFADTNPTTPPVTTGQPGSSAGVTCFSSAATANAPGESMSAAGSVFNPSGEAGEVYAGNPNTPSLANGSSAAVSQYDIACLQVTPP